MDEIVTINLAGKPYVLEVSAYALLKDYLSRARAALGDNPDADEIMEDLERAVADKAELGLSPHKTVVSRADMTKILELMGPVEGESASASGKTNEGPPRRLYRIRDKHSWTGVSAGLAAYFDLDVKLIRLIWILGTLVTGGALAVLYVVLMFTIPSAKSPQDVAAAFGAPFNAQDIIDNARRNFEEYSASGAAFWRANGGWRRSVRRQGHAESAPVPLAAQLIAGLLAVLLSLLSFALLAGALAAAYFLVTTGAVLGFTPPSNVPLWVSLLVVFLIYGAVAGPLTAMYNATVSAMSGRDQGWRTSSGPLGLIVAVAALWMLYHYVPGFADGMNAMIEALRRALIEAQR